MYPTSIIIIGYVFIILVIVSGISYFLKPFIRRLIWGISVSILIIVIGYFALLPILVESQTNEAIGKLNTYLTTIYPNEKWEINDTDDDQLKTTVELHVIFENEYEIVYAYYIKDKEIGQSDFWSQSGASSEELIAEGFVPIHLEVDGK